MRVCVSTNVCIYVLYVYECMYTNVCVTLTSYSRFHFPISSLSNRQSSSHSNWIVKQSLQIIVFYICTVCMYVYRYYVFTFLSYLSRAICCMPRSSNLLVKYTQKFIHTHIYIHELKVVEVHKVNDLNAEKYGCGAYISGAQIHTAHTSIHTYIRRLKGLEEQVEVVGVQRYADIHNQVQ